MARAPVGLQHDEDAGLEEQAGHERKRSMHDSASLHSHESVRSDETDKSIASSVVSWIRSSFGGCG
jgi:hypothetical protein